MKRFLLVFWVLGMLAPMAWLAHFIPGYERIFNFIFGPPWMHWVSHALLFAVLCFLLLWLWGDKELTWQRVLGVLLLVLLAIFLQEKIQLWYKARAWGADEWFDAGVDMMGALAGAGVWWLVVKLHLTQSH